jgi:outer membrane protein assembly factor BamC
VVQLDEPFDRAWRRVGLTLDRSGFTVEDRDRSQGLYFVRFIDQVQTQKDSGFFGRLFSSRKEEGTLVKYRVQLKASDKGTTVSVLNASGAPETSATAQRIVQIIADDLK